MPLPPSDQPPAPAQPVIAITGYGLVSPLGTSAWQTYSALLAGRTIGDRADRLGDQAEGSLDPVSLVRATGCVANAQHSAADPAIDLAEAAARQALRMADEGRPGRGPVGDAILATSKGAMHALTAAAGLATAGALPASWPRISFGTIAPARLPADAALTLGLGPADYLAHHLQRRLEVRIHRTIVAACASSLTALHLARLWLLDESDPHRPRRLLVVSSEAALLPMFIHSYHRLGVLPDLTPRGYRGRPLDRRRGGFMPAELAAAVVLERVEAETGQAPPAKGPFLLATAIASEGFDVVRTDPVMPALARIARQLLSGRRIDVLHPHATGTVDNDQAELAVYAAALGLGRDRSAAHGPGPGTMHVPPHPSGAGTAHAPAVYACKGALGHGLGAAGLVSLVLACLAARTRRLPPMPWLTDPLDSPLLAASAATGGGGGAPADLPAASTHAIFAAGFGGHVAGAVIAGG